MLHVRSLSTVLFELITIVLIAAANICYVMSCPKMEYGVKTERWWTHTVIFTISSCMIIWLFADYLQRPKSVCMGGMAKFLTNRMALYIGNISSFSFLIHAVVFRYIDAVCKLLFGSEFDYFYGKWFKLSLGLILTIGVTQVWLLLIHKKVKF